MTSERNKLGGLLGSTLATVARSLEDYRPKLTVEEVGRVESVGRGVARVVGLPKAQSMELLRFPGNSWGLAFNLDPEEVGVVLLDRGHDLAAGMQVERTQRVLDIPVGDALLGRVVDGLGRPLDASGPLRTAARLPVERPAPAIMDREPVTVPLLTGIKVIDALVPVGRGQRQLILGDRQTGKTALAVDAILNQRDQNVVCVYCAIGQRRSSAARVVEDLRQRHALPYTCVIVTTEDDPPGVQYVAPYAAMTVAEYFMGHGRDVLLVLDDLTRHARAYRELSLLLRRPPGREAFPGDIFYVHSRLLERSTHLRQELGGGSITTLPIVETEAQNISAYIPTNLISITDGQIYLSPDLFDKGILPAVDVGKSVSRVGGKTQLAAFRAIAGDLRLAYTQFEELEAFARFATRLDEATRRTIERGRRVREVLKQPQYDTLSVAEQIAVLIAAVSGALDAVPVGRVAQVERFLRSLLHQYAGQLNQQLSSGVLLEASQRDEILRLTETAKSMALQGTHTPSDSHTQTHGNP
jgi:F-type H+-transporting ATPase subunit alpha